MWDKDPVRWTQVWYADNASSCGTFGSLKNGPNFGYFPKPLECFWSLIPSMPQRLKKFVDLGINIVCSHKLLGGIVGSHPGRRGSVEDLEKK